jgi:DNA-damage-inducible protein J
MAATAFVRARVDENLKNDAAIILAEMGLTVSDIVRMTLARVVNDKALPFELKIPNAKTKAAMMESRTIMKAKKNAL